MKKRLKTKAVSPVQHVKAMMAARRRSLTTISELRKLLTEKSARQVALETTGDLGEPAVISEIGKLHVLVDLLPRRIAFLEGEDARAEQQLVEATNKFIREHLGPRVRQLAGRTRAMVENELSSHIQDAAALIRAVAQSERVRKVVALDWSVTLQPERGAMAHAEGALKAWAEVDEFERALSLQCQGVS